MLQVAHYFSWSRNFGELTAEWFLDVETLDLSERQRGLKSCLKPPGSWNLVRLKRSKKVGDDSSNRTLYIVSTSETPT
ncbi:hypothetical protein J6590_058288 [Homalodisca vitripennis]|nr:hypothetical protein J6590_058288 [Homalodisca vitripennis]